MSWLAAATALVKLALGIVNWLNERKLIKAGEDRVIAETAKELISKTSIAHEIEESYAKKTKEEIIKTLEADFRD